MGVRVGADELKGHVDLIAGTRDGALEDAVDVEFAGDCGERAGARR